MSILARDALAGLGEAHRSWGWILALGILFVVLGVACIAYDVTATFATMLVFGVMMFISGVAALFQAFAARNWSGSLLYLLSALLRGFTGYLLIRYPGAGAVAVTLVLASFFVVGGLFRIFGAGMIKFPRYGWAVFSGCLSLLLGILLLVQLPVSSIWFIGFAIGVELIIEGISLIGFATAVHRLPSPPSQQLA
jgi:uncharacterized membrane protein HdeD (DUF308 family)